MKNEKTPSIASVCPITPPAVFENADQLVPNWNSNGISGDHADDEIDAEDATPEARGLFVVPIASTKRECLEDHDKERETHR
jgi:hypothetical protein